jgi:hypothetical protein
MTIYTRACHCSRFIYNLQINYVGRLIIFCKKKDFNVIDEIEYMHLDGKLVHSFGELHLPFKMATVTAYYCS